MFNESEDSIFDDFKTFWESNLAGVQGWLSVREAYCLAQIGLRAEKPIAEIGAYRGKSSIALAWGMQQSRMRNPIWSVDPHLMRPPTTSQRVYYGPADLAHWYFNVGQQQSGLSSLLNKLVLTSEQAAKVVTTPLDAVFIDGNHEFEFVMQDTQLWGSRVVYSGLIAYHDCRESGVSHAIEKALGLYDLKPVWSVDRLAAYCKGVVNPKWFMDPKFSTELDSWPPYHGEDHAGDQQDNRLV